VLAVKFKNFSFFHSLISLSLRSSRKNERKKLQLDKFYLDIDLTLCCSSSATRDLCGWGMNEFLDLKFDSLRNYKGNESFEVHAREI
jgi:hypothetical protein